MKRLNESKVAAGNSSSVYGGEVKSVIDCDMTGCLPPAGVCVSEASMFDVVLYLFIKFILNVEFFNFV